MSVDQKTTNGASDLDWSRLQEMISEADGPVASIYEALKGVSLRYLRSDAVGAGGLKQIVRTHDQMTGRAVAMAVLHDPDNPAAVEHFLREARIMAHLEHSNIVPLYDVGLDATGSPFFTMKLLSGENLGSVIATLKSSRRSTEVPTNGLGLPGLLDIFLKVCDAVAYAHSQGIVHLDLKPENIQVSDYGEVRVCDWGLAKIINSNCESDTSLLDDDALFQSCVNFLTMHGTVKGTPGYMAPEQVKSRQSVKDQRTDIYALGAILYTILTFECPIEGPDVGSVLERTRLGFFTSPQQRAPDIEVPTSLNAVVLKCMALRPDDRYQNVVGIHHDINAYRDGFATRAEEAGFLTQLSLLVKRNRRTSLLIIVSFFLILSIIGFSSYEVRERERDTRLALNRYQNERTRRENLESAPDFYYSALEEYEDRAYQDAIVLVDRALQYDRNLFRAWELKGHLHFLFEQYGEAAAAYEKADDSGLEEWLTLSSRLHRVLRRSKKLNRLEKSLRIIREFPVGEWSGPAALWLNEVMDSGVSSVQMNVLARAVLSRQISRKSKLRYDYHLDEDGNGVLDISRNSSLSSVQVLRGMTNLVELNLGGTRVSELSSLSDLPLRVLKLGGMSQLSNLSALREIESLVYLDLSSTAVSNVDALRGLELSSLNLSHSSKITDEWLRVLFEHCKIETLVVARGQFLTTSVDMFRGEGTTVVEVE